MSAPAKAQTDSAAMNPLYVEVTRGSMVESVHRSAFAVGTVDGKIVRHGGEIDRPVYPRSAIKPLQALALVESGAADAFALSDAEISLACASHSGEPRHTDTVRAWLGRIGCTVADLECGAHLPYDEAATVALLRSGAEPDAAHNNCSGKHSGFLSVARHLGYPTHGYIGYEHPVQQRVLGILESMTGLDLGSAPRGIDGCGIPTIGIPLGNLALAMARFAAPADQPEARQSACARIRRAIAAEPFMIAGSGRFCTRVIEATAGRVLIKTGAEGIYCGAIPEAGLGIALKVDDGAARAAECLMGRLVQELGVLDPDARAKLDAALPMPILNRMGREVGEVRPAAAAPF